MGPPIRASRITPEDDEYIKAGPDFDDNGDIPDEYWNYAATGLSIAIGAKSWAVGSGISIAGALRNYVANTDQGGEYDLTYQWGDTGENPVSTPPCGTHFVFQVVEGSDDDGEFKFDFIDEAWGNYPNYTKIEFELDFTDPASPTRTPKYESTSEGDIVTDSKGQDINITEITESVTQFEPTQDSKEIPVEKLPRRIRKRVDIKNGTVTRHRLPATVKKTSIGGKVLER